jgi:Secretion system C-terminal sorting domain
MKKRVLFFACLCVLFSFNLWAQRAPFSVEWVTVGTGSSSYGIQKNIVGDAAGTGLETAAGAFGTLGTLELYTYSNNNNAAAVNDLVSGQAWGRYRAISAVPNFSGIGSYDADEYVQYVIEPSNGKFLRVTTISMVALGGGTSDMRMLVMYAIKNGSDVPAEADFKAMPTVANYFNAVGDPVSYEAKDVATAISLVASNATANTQAKRTITFSGLQINVDAGQKAYFRFFPYLGTSTSSSRYLFLRNTIFSGITSTVTLPLDLLAFSAKPDAMGKTVNISWKTANEVNTQDFVVERRSDDTEFKAIEVVQSKNITGTHNYTYIDKNPLAGTSYYRLKQRDINGEFTYSAIVDVKLKGLSLSLHPNPVGNELVVNHEYVQKTAAVKVVGLDGKSLLQTNSSIGTTSTIVNVSALPKGTYVLVYDANGKPQSQKFIKK